jgi:hypothetical protein
MEWAALITWVATAGLGFIMLFIWLARGGMRQQGEPGTRIRPLLILSHFLLAAAGLVVWIVYLANDKHALTWVAFALLGIVALLGWTMFAIWWQRRSRPGVGATVAETAGGAAAGAQPAEQSFPVAVVALHGLLAVTTVVLVLLTALKIGTGGGGEYGL